MTADQLRTNIDALETALARGERTVQFEDRSVTYESAQGIIERINYFKGELSRVTNPRSRQTLGVSVRGY